MAFAQLSRVRSKTHDSPQTTHGQTPAYGQQPAAAQVGFGRPIFRSPTALLPATPVGRTTLKVGVPDDTFEQEADHIANQAIAAPSPHAVNNALPRIGRAAGQPAGQAGEAPASISHVLAGPGRPLEPALQQAMEWRFAHDFSRVRLHTGAAAAQSAQEVNAHAYAAGSNIVFGMGKFAPATHDGRRLIAHELVHVLQQQTMQHATVMRQPANQPAPPQPTQGFETDVAVLDRANMEAWGQISYWLDRVGRLFVISFAAETAERFKDLEERDAVLAALWRVKPDPSRLRGDVVKYVQIPPQGRSKRSSAELLYRFVFSPKGNGQPKPQVTIYFEAENQAGVLAFAPTVPAGQERRKSRMATDIGEGLTQLHYHHEGFPDGDSIGYWAHHPDEEKQLFYWIDLQGPSFTQIVITRTTERKGKSDTLRRTSFLVRGHKDKNGRIVDLSIELLDRSFDLTQVWLQQDYHRKDGGDILLERIQDQPDPNKQDRLGKVTLGNVSADEAVPLKYSIWGYFQMGTRNAEVDATITTIGTNKRVFYTIRFRSNNDVDVERIGEEKAEARLDPRRLDVTTVRGFASHPDDPAKVSAWLRKRYPRLKAEGQSEAELLASANKSLAAEVGKPEWFRDNYQIHILDAKGAEQHLKRLGWQREQLNQVKNFAPEELQLLEIALETLSDSFLGQLRETRLVRQAIHIAFDKAQRKYVAYPKNQGVTTKLSTSSKNTVVIFDAAMDRSTERFLGGAPGVRPASIMTFTHEFGHAIAYKTRAAAEFNQFVKDEGITPFTPYAAKDPAQEFFAEAFFLYSSDPEWLKSSQPKVFAWFEALSAKLGQPAVKSKSR
jgi:hypothetical protein